MELTNIGPPLVLGGIFPGQTLGQALSVTLSSGQVGESLFPSTVLLVPTPEPDTLSLCLIVVSLFLPAFRRGLRTRSTGSPRLQNTGIKASDGFYFHKVMIHRARNNRPKQALYFARYSGSGLLFVRTRDCAVRSREGTQLVSSVPHPIRSKISNSTKLTNPAAKCSGEPAAPRQPQKRTTSPQIQGLFRPCYFG